MACRSRSTELRHHGEAERFWFDLVDERVASVQPLRIFKRYTATLSDVTPTGASGGRRRSCNRTAPNGRFPGGHQGLVTPAAARPAGLYRVPEASIGPPTEGATCCCDDPHPGPPGGRTGRAGRRAAQRRAYPPFRLPILSFVAVTPASCCCARWSGSAPSGLLCATALVRVRHQCAVLYLAVVALWHFTPLAGSATRDHRDLRALTAVHRDGKHYPQRDDRTATRTRTTNQNSAAVQRPKIAMVAR